MLRMAMCMGQAIQMKNTQRHLEGNMLLQKVALAPRIAVILRRIKADGPDFRADTF